ncbi:MAG: class I SAM-dependent methyltransferase [Rhabdochlamydiaceae bacterium]
MDTTQNHLWHAEEYHSHSFVQDEAATKIMHYFQLEGHEQVLDVGCGDGKITARIASYVLTGSVTGIDISPEMINFACKTFPKEHFPNLTFLKQDAQYLNYNNEFDIIFSSFALQWVPDLSSFFKCIYKSLKSSGYIAVTIPLNISLPLEESIKEIIALPQWSPYFFNFSPKWHFITASKYKQLLEDQHFILTQFTTVPQAVTFSSRKHFEKYVAQWFSYLRPLPQHLKHFFFKQIIDKYLEINPISTNGEVSFNFLRLDFIANKAIP